MRIELRELFVLLTFSLYRKNGLRDAVSVLCFRIPRISEESWVGGLRLKIRVLFSMDPCRKTSTLPAFVFRLQVTS